MDKVTKAVVNREAFARDMDARTKNG
jgi:hypothetical protein